MVNGTLSRILYVGATILVGICLLGIIALGMTDHAVPYELTGALTTSTAFLFGAHVRPPLATRSTAPGEDDQP